jgi:predicted nucleic acid-binding protein
VALTEPSSIVVCDAGPLIHLDELESLDLLEGFAGILIPHQVQAEVVRHRPQALVAPPFSWTLHEVEISTSPRFEALMSAFSLGLGEQAAITLMQSFPRAILLCDDAAARVVSKALGYRSQGTIGLVLRALRRGQRSPMQTLALLRGMPERSTLHIRRSLLESVIEEVEKDFPGDLP